MTTPDPQTHRRDDPPESGIRLAPGVSVPAAAVRFAFSRSAGPGGQNVNKLSTKAELRIAVGDLPLPPRAARRLRALAGRRIVGATEVFDAEGRAHEAGGELILTAESHRSQGRNKDECLDKLRELLLAALSEPKPRRKTRPTKGSVERRIEAKKQRSQTKQHRSNRPHD